MNDLFNNTKKGDLFKDSRGEILTYCYPDAGYHVLSTRGGELETYYSDGTSCDYEPSLNIQLIEKLT